jgi:hypothetical protein
LIIAMAVGVILNTQPMISILNTKLNELLRIGEDPYCENSSCRG